MNYKESKKILEEIKKAKKILINCHAGVDPDSISSATSLNLVLSKMHKKVTLASPEKPSLSYNFITPVKNIKLLDFNNADYSQYGLFIIIDSEDWSRVFRKKSPKHVKVINIDHHVHNSIKGEINIVDPMSSSTSEMLYSIFQDWGISIDKNISTVLLTGIYSDTGFFQFANTTSRTYKIAGELLERGADFNYIILNLKRRRNINLVKMWGEIAIKAQVDTKYKFSWSAIPHEVFKKYNVRGISPTSEAVDLFLRVIDGVNFAICMVEKEEKKLHLSLRARITGFDVSPIAQEFGGGGHKDASGATVEGLPFDKAVEKVLKVAKKYARKNQQSEKRN